MAGRVSIAAKTISKNLNLRRATIFLPDHAASMALSLTNEFFEPLGPSNISPTILGSEPIFLAKE